MEILKGKNLLTVTLFFLFLPYVFLLLFLWPLFLMVLLPCSIIALLLYILGDHQESIKAYPNLSAAAQVLSIVMSIMGILGGLIGWGLIFIVTF
jgi:hypothetical protein